MKPLGHMDFYPNGGGTQPGCILDPFLLQKIQVGVENPIENYIGKLLLVCTYIPSSLALKIYFPI